MLSREAEQFILELKMYLMAKGKKDQEINEVIEELTDHLVQAEAEGKDIQEIIGESPREYMKSIGREMDFDVKEVLVLIPMTALLLMAFISFVPAVAGDFTLSKPGMIGFLIGVILGLVLYGFLFLRVLPRIFYSKWFYILVALAYVILTGFFVVMQFLDKDPFFVATPMQNNIILAVCVLIFMIWSFYAKTWTTIIVPLFLAMGPVAERFFSEEINAHPVLSVCMVVFATLLLCAWCYWLYKKDKKRSA